MLSNALIHCSLRVTSVLACIAIAATPCHADFPWQAGDPEFGLFNIASGLRVATFNASLNRNSAGQLVSDLSTPNNPQAKVIAEIIQRVNPDIVLINEFDYVENNVALNLFRQNYLEVSQNTTPAVHYPYGFTAPSNTGIPSGFDLNNNGVIGGADDAYGFGFFPGQFGMAVYSKHPIDLNSVRTFQNFLWKDMPGAKLPDDPNTPAPKDWYSPAELAVFRLSSKSHWDVPVNVNGKVIHILASHPTPPVFDGPEDRNGTRNFDEIRFWADYVRPFHSSYIYDDNGTNGGLPWGARFVVLGDLNSDPEDGDSIPGAAQQLLNHPLIDSRIAPAAEGGIEQAALQGGANASHDGDPATDTADFADTAPGNLRADYVLPSLNLSLSSAGIFWPELADPLFGLAGTFPFPSSDHRMVWIDLALAGTTLPNGVAAGDVTDKTAVLWTHSTASGLVRFDYSQSPSFGSGTKHKLAFCPGTLDPVKVEINGLKSDTTYYFRAIDLAGSVEAGKFRTAARKGQRVGLTFGVSGDWRGELGPYPSVNNAPSRGLDFFIALGDTIYADVESPILPYVDQAITFEEYLLKNHEVYSPRYGVNSLGALRGSTAILATIDDHEVTNDFAGGAHPSSDPRFAAYSGAFINETDLYKNGLKAFSEFNPIADRKYGNTGDPRTRKKTKLYRSQAYGNDAAVFMIDARSFRDQELAPVANPFDPAQVGAFLAASFDPSRTMLGAAQLDELKYDLLEAQCDEVVWKFIVVPEPIQNLGVIGAPDRFEGYAAERTEILAFIEEYDITNVVFIAADIHGTLVNNLTYSVGPFSAQIPTSAFEVTTGAVAYDAPFGPTIVSIGASLGLLTPAQVAFYQSLPIAAKEAFLVPLLNGVVTGAGYDAVGLDGSPINATLLQGGYTATHTYGWTEFEINAQTSELTVTTWGIPPYTESDMLADFAALISMQPQIINQFRVVPQLH